MLEKPRLLAVLRTVEELHPQESAHCPGGNPEKHGLRHSDEGQNESSVVLPESSWRGQRKREGWDVPDLLSAVQQQPVIFHDAGFGSRFPTRLLHGRDQRVQLPGRGYSRQTDRQS